MNVSRKYHHIIADLSSSKKQFPQVRQTWIPPVIQVAILLWGRKNQSGFWSWWRPGTSQISCKFQREFPFSFFPGGKDTVIDPVKGGKGQFGRRFLDKWWRLLGNLCDPKTSSSGDSRKKCFSINNLLLHSLMFFLNREWSYSAKHDHLEHNPQQKGRAFGGFWTLLLEGISLMGQGKNGNIFKLRLIYNILNNISIQHCLQIMIEKP